MGIARTAKVYCQLYDALFQEGAAYGLTDLGSYAFNGMRMEKAYRASAELTTDVGPFDVGLDRFVITQDRDFVGKKALLSQDPEWTLFYAELHTDEFDIQGGEPVLLGGKPVGLTTRAGMAIRSGNRWGGCSCARAHHARV